MWKKGVKIEEGEINNGVNREESSYRSRRSGGKGDETEEGTGGDQVSGKGSGLGQK